MSQVEHNMMDGSSVVGEIRRLFTLRGDSMYGGESVTQLEHGLQAAHMAESDGADTATIAAAFLHDIGHLLHDLEDDAPDKGVDDVHEQLADEWLTHYFPPEVTEPIRLHVAAKRYLCTVEESYYQELSEPSIVSLKLQGGKLTNDEVKAFEQHPNFEQIIQVRRYDDRAKVVGMATSDMEHFLAYVQQCVTRSEAIEAQL